MADIYDRSTLSVRIDPTEEELVERLARAYTEEAIFSPDENQWKSYTTEARCFLAMMKALQDG